MNSSVSRTFGNSYPRLIQHKVCIGASRVGEEWAHLSPRLCRTNGGPNGSLEHSRGCDARLPTKGDRGGNCLYSHEF